MDITRRRYQDEDNARSPHKGLTEGLWPGDGVPCPALKAGVVRDDINQH